MILVTEPLNRVMRHDCTLHMSPSSILCSVFSAENAAIQDHNAGSASVVPKNIDSWVRCEFT